MISIKNIDKNIVEAPEEVSSKSRPRKRVGNKISFILFILVVALTVMYVRQRKEVARLTDPVIQTEYAQKQVEKVITELKKTVVVPDDEQLQLLGVIKDADALKKDQPFYANVQNGDYVFLFAKSSRALIWRPTENKVVNFGVADTSKAQQNTQQPSQTENTAPAPAASETSSSTKKDR